MRKLFVGILCFLSSMAHSQGASSWDLVEVTDSQRNTSGYIYHTASVGTAIDQKQKAITGLRLVCSTKGTNRGAIVAIFWNGENSNTPQSPEISVDNQIIDTGVWDIKGPILIKPFAESAKLLQAMSKGKTVSVKWNDSGARRHTIFSLRGYDISEFNKNCNL